LLSLENVTEYALYVQGWNEPCNGVFCWSYQKEGSPTCLEALKKAKESFGKKVTFEDPIVQEPVKNVPGIGNCEIRDLKNEVVRLKSVLATIKTLCI
jgi:hypothetical protein